MVFCGYGKERKEEGGKEGRVAEGVVHGVSLVLVLCVVVGNRSVMAAPVYVRTSEKTRKL